MKKKILLILSVILVISFGTFNMFAFGSEEPAIKVSSAEGSIGETVSVTVSLENNPGICTARLAVYYDEGLTLVGATDAGLFDDGVFGGNLSENPYYLTWDASTADKNNMKNGVIATLEFRINKDAAPGDHEIVIGYAPDDVYNLDLENVEFKSVIGTVNVLAEGIPVTGIYLEKTSATVSLSDKTLTIKASVLPEYAWNKGISWRSCNEDVATVKDGVVTLLKHGEAEIIATTEDGGYSGSFYLTVRHEGGEATCIASAVCDLCGISYGSPNPDNHKNKVLKNVKTPSCSKEGYTGDLVCTDCNTVISKGTVIEKSPHSYTEEIVEPTYEERGYTLHKCTECGYEYKDNYTECLTVYGDVNGDGKVNNLDRLVLSRWIAKWPDYIANGIDTRAADLNRDGRVNGKDRLILTRYLAKWPDYTVLPHEE